MTARVLVVVVDVHRAHLLSANHRGHWSVRRSVSRVLRDTAALELRRAIGPVSPPSAVRPWMTRAHVLVEVAWPTRRRRDVANVAPTVKALVDGLVTDGHLLPDDDDAHLIGPDLRSAPHLSGTPGMTRFTFRIEEQP
ncbi:hypothetical protein [Cellulomonas iranensis]|uniref:hypothetical protein n=1 Tax=Cellulomonas iranensis TaxID=76862 RepID=UPI000B3CE167|nr:hypothetical protein [Cellulomonas iranensis]